MFNQVFNCQNIFKQESSKITKTYFFPSKNQARLSISFFIPSKNQARQQLLMKAQSRSGREFWHQKARDQEFQASLALLCSVYKHNKYIYPWRLFYKCNPYVEQREKMNNLFPSKVCAICDSALACLSISPSVIWLTLSLCILSVGERREKEMSSWLRYLLGYKIIM